MRRDNPLITDSTYHIYNRGIEKRIIFPNNSFYSHFLEVIAHSLKYSVPYSVISTRIERATSPAAREAIIENLETKIIKPAVDIISFCLMPNHFHFVFKQLNEDGITNFMRRICTSYTKYFNKRQDRVGGLFQGRFKSVKVESDEQLIHVTRYQHINPQKLGLDSVNQLIEYPWSSLNTYLARRDFYSFLNTDLVLGEFGSREEYKKFTEAEIDQFGVMRLKDVAIDDDFGWFRKFEELDKNQKAELVEQYKEMAY